MLKNLKRGDVVSIDWINAGDLDDCQFGVRGRHELTNVYQPTPGTNAKTSKSAPTLPAST